MRVARIVEKGAGYYHVMSRVVGREKVFRAESELAEWGQVDRR